MKSWITPALSLLLALALTTGSAEGASIIKEETVYMTCTAEGTPTRWIDSVRLINSEGRAVIKDVAHLAEVMVVKGNATFERGDADQIIWHTAGEDVYYQGLGATPAPVQLKVTATLDGAPIAPEALAGRSGHVVMRFAYTGTHAETVEIDGDEATLISPHIVIGLTFLDNEVFEGVRVTNGFSFDDGSRTFIVGYAFPGLQETLGMDANTLALPDAVEIEADVTDFSLLTTLSIVTNEIFTEMAWDDGDHGWADFDVYALLSRISGLSESLLRTATNALGGWDRITTSLGDLISNLPTIRTGLNEANIAMRSAAGQATEAAEALAATAEARDVLRANAEACYEAWVARSAAYLTTLGVPAVEWTRDTYRDCLTEWAADPRYDEATRDAIQREYEALTRYDALYAAIGGYTDAMTEVQSSLTDAAVSMSAGAEWLSRLYEELQESQALLDLMNNRIVRTAAERTVDRWNGYADRLRAAVALAKTDTTYAGQGADMTGRVRWIIVTESIG